MSAYGEPGSYGYDADGKLLPYANHRPEYADGQVEEVWDISREEQLAQIEDGQLPLPKPDHDNQMWVRVRDGAEGDGLVDLAGQGKWRLIEWDPGKPREGVWDMGHLPSEKYSVLRDDYLSGRIDKDEFLSRYRDPESYIVEDPSRNRSHEAE